MIVDDFIDSFEDLRQAALNGIFCDEINDIDGVTYPLICSEIPDNVKNEIISKLEEMAGRPIVSPLMFMRRSPAGVHCPNKVHSDNSMGDLSLMLYINEQEGAGTSILRHVLTGIAYAPADANFVNLVAADSNNDSAWEITEMVDMKANRAFVFRSDLMHRAEPMGGFGDGAGARVVLTCFFS